MTREKPHLRRQRNGADVWWRCDLPIGSHGEGSTPEAAHQSARNAEAWRLWLLQRAAEAERPRRGGLRGKLMFGEPKVWLASDPHAPRPNERVTC